MSDPIRTCVGCRTRAGKAELLRLVWTSDGLRPDPGQSEPGRGAYLHRDGTCLERALKRKALRRALRLTGAGPDPTSVRAALAGHLD